MAKRKRKYNYQKITKFGYKINKIKHCVLFRELPGYLLRSLVFRKVTLPINRYLSKF